MLLVVLKQQEEPEWRAPKTGDGSFAAYIKKSFGKGE